MPRQSIPVAERLIVALDVPTAADARAMVTELGDSVQFYKIGLQLLMGGEYFPLIDWLASQQKKIFADIKFFDVPQTVASAVSQLTQLPVTFVTVHGNDAIMRAAAEVKGPLKILAVTVLTSLDQGDVESLGFPVDVEALVLSRATRALAVGCDGVVASGLEAVALRRAVDERLLVIVPGVRPVANDDDQKRTVNVEQAFANGADYIVVGRPILQAGSRRAAAEEMQARIRQHLS
jgi:orotidine-5'-phosphate decarboxylase